MKTLVTGATGFIGSHIVDHLLERGDDVWALVRPHSNTQRLECQGVHLIQGDLSDVEALNLAVKDVDVIFHAAALLSKANNKTIRETNLIGTENLLKACVRQRASRFVFISSISVYLPTSARLIDEYSPLGGVDAYGQSKADAEEIIRHYGSVHGINFSILRPCRVYGERDKNYTVRLLKSKLRRPIILVASGGWPYYNLVHASDVANAAILAATCSGAIGETFNITDGRGALLQEIAQTAREISGQRQLILPIPKYLVKFAYQVHAMIRNRSLSNKRDNNFMWQQLFQGQRIDISKARLKLDYEPKIDLQEGIRRALAWYG